MSNITKDALLKRIGEIKDPDFNMSLSELEAIDEIEITGSVVQVHLSLINPIQWVYPLVKEAVSAAVSEMAPDHNVEIFINAKKSPARAGNVLPKVKNLIAIASGKGGVGKSSITANIAAALALKGVKVGILDADVYGPSQPLMFGLSGEQLPARQNPDGSTVAVPIEKYGVKVASMGFVLQREQAAIVRGPMLAGYFSMLFEQVEWDDLDVLLFDLPPGTGDVQLTLTQKIPLTGAVIVTTPQEISMADVRRSITMLKRVEVHILGIVENMSYFTPDDMPDKKYYIFGEGGGKAMAEEHNTNLLGEIPLDTEMRDSTDSGMPVVLDPKSKRQAAVIKETAANIIKQVRIRNYFLYKEGESDIDISI